MFKHTTVLLEESIQALNIKPDGVYVDATLGGGGHSALILESLSEKGRLICFDQDQIAVDNAKIKFNNNKNVIIIKANFKDLIIKLKELNIKTIDGILFDLGVSSMQIDNFERGFSYMHDGPLDMRMDTSNELTAQKIINTYTIRELENIFKKYGEEKFAHLIAKVIVNTREEYPITTTKQLSDLILNCIPKKVFYSAKSHPSIRVFQAIRIEVNKELDVFEETLIACKDILNSSGRIAVITFHSLEDRICKYYFREWTQLPTYLEKLPVIPKQLSCEFKRITTKPITSSEKELLANSRSKSARLRVLERI